MLGFYADLGLFGLWIGLLVASVCVAVSFLVVVGRTNWADMALRAKQRLAEGNGASLVYMYTKWSGWLRSAVQRAAAGTRLQARVLCL